MIIDSNSNGFITTENFDFCIIGGGPAGITTALNLRKNSSIFLAEAGSMEYSEISQKNYDHDKTTYYFDNKNEPYRLRFFGGTSNHWGGNVFGYNKEDIPIKFDEFLKYEAKAKKILGIKYEKNFSFGNDINVSNYARSTVNFGEKYLNEIKKRKNIFGHLNCNLMNLNMIGDKVASVTFSNYKGEKKLIKAKKFIFAMGPFENIRMIKFFFDKSTYKWKKLVGKNWTDHLNSFYLGNFIVFDEKKIFKGNTKVVGLALHDDVIKKYKLPQGNLHFEYYKSNKCDLLPKRILDNFKDFGPFKSCYGEINANFDNYTNGSSNSLELSKEKKCQFGIPSLSVFNNNDGWDKEKVDKYLIEFAKLFAEHELGRVRLDSKYGFDGWSHHQMMGTPISNNSNNGVVDENLKIFGIDNLYTVGGNVFNKTLSGKNPTLMVTILSLRLSNYLNNLLI
jgi:hypothetical protein